MMFLLDIKPDQAVIEKRYLLRAGHGGNLDGMATGVLGKCYLCFITYFFLIVDLVEST